MPTSFAARHAILNRPASRRGIHGATLLGLALLYPIAAAHNVDALDAAHLEAAAGPQPVTYLYLGAKHMVTGYDHLLYLAGVIFYLRRTADVAVYVTLFALGHSLTLLAGVLANWQVNPFLVDAVIGFSVAYKAFENLGGMRHVPYAPDPRAAVFVFGLVHGLGLATKLQALSLPADGLVLNMLAFNGGVEIGQLLALMPLLLLLTFWREQAGFTNHARVTHWLLMTAGFVLLGSQLSGYFLA